MPKTAGVEPSEAGKFAACPGFTKSLGTANRRQHFLTPRWPHDALTARGRARPPRKAIVSPTPGRRGAIAHGAGRRAKLNKVFDLEPIRAQQADPVPVAKMELDRRVIGPLEAVHAELGSQQAVGCRHAVLFGSAEHQQGAVAEKDELRRGEADAPPRESTDRVRPDGSAVLTDDEIKGTVPQRYLFTGS